MRRIAYVLVILLLLPLVQASETIQTVDLSLERTLQTTDTGVISGAISPDKNDVLLVGQNGFIMLIDADEPDEKSRDLELDTNRNVAIRSADWHRVETQHSLLAIVGLRCDTTHRTIVSQCSMGRSNWPVSI